MTSQTSGAETSGANATVDGNNLHYLIQVDSVEQLPHANQHFVKELLDPRNWQNEPFLKLLDNHFDDTHKTMNFYSTAVQEYLNSPNNYQSLIQDGEEVSWEAPLNTSHHHFFHDLDGVCRQQLQMQGSLQSCQNDLAQKLHRAEAWTKVSVVAFTAAVLITSAAAAATARTPAMMAAAATAPVLMGTIGSWALSFLRKYKDGVKKHFEITCVMVLGAKIIMSALKNLRSSARSLECRTQPVLEMAELADAGEVRKNLVALMESFQELQEKAADFCRDIRFVRKLTLQSVIKHLDLSRESNSGLVTKILFEDLKFEVFQLYTK